MVAPPLIATEADIEEICALLENSLNELRAALAKTG